MELNYRQQDKYTPDNFKIYIEVNGQIVRDTNYLEIDHIIRDISFVRHECTKYSYLFAGQFRFQEMLTLPYWDFLFLKGNINEQELEDIQDGCLLIIALFFVEVFDNVGITYIYSNQLLEKLDNALKFYQPTTDRQKRAVEKIKFIRQHIDDSEKISQNHSGTRELVKVINENFKWIYEEFIENYFWEIAKSFEANRQRTTDLTNKIIGKQNKPPDKNE